MSIKQLRPFFPRTGTKVPLIKDILRIIPSHTRYVETFVGGGAIFWNKPVADENVINDLDDELIEAYKILKRIPPSADMGILDNALKVGKTYPEVQDFINNITINSSDRDKLVATTKKYTGTWSSSGKGCIYRNSSINRKWKNIEKYKAILEKTTILNTDYLEVLKQYDDENTFFFLDPPYELIKRGANKLYTHSIIDYEQMRDTLKELKGKFLLTINDSQYIREVFKDFNIVAIQVRNQSNLPNMLIETRNRAELFITNYQQ